MRPPFVYFFQIQQSVLLAFFFHDTCATMQDANFNQLLQRREEEAQHVVKTSTQLKEIHLACLYFPFSDPQAPQHILSMRWMTRLDVFLNSLGAEQSNSNPRAWNNDGFKSLKAEEIIRRLRPKPPPSVIWDYEWSPSMSESTTDASQIADDINSDVTEAFRNVPFTELVRVACGYPSNIITSLLGGVSTTRSELSCLLQECHTLRSKFKLVEKASPSRALQEPQDINFFSRSCAPSILSHIG
jgi:hypothetical protein